MDDSWKEQGICKQVDPELFFPIAKSGQRAEQAALAIRVCAQCPVIRECWAYAVAKDERFGIWGGADFESGSHNSRYMQHLATLLRNEKLAPITRLHAVGTPLRDRS
jgi:WhiB family redox-sensing transcriptional regulator